MAAVRIPTYSPADIAERNKFIDEQCAKIAPLARAVFESAVRRESANINAEAIAEEASSALADLLANPAAKTRVDEASAGLAKALADALKEKPAPRSAADEKAWLDRRGRDLARAVVGFWINLGKDAVARHRASIEVLDAIAASRETKASRNFRTIFSRFWLGTEEASQLLNRVAIANLAIPIAGKVSATLAKRVYGRFEQFFQPQPEPSPVYAQLLRQGICEFVVRMPVYTVECKPALGLIGKMDRVYASKLKSIRRGPIAVRKRRIAALMKNKAMAQVVVEKTFAVSTKPAASVKIRSKTTRSPAKSHLA
ncbi:MAG: hypothetical protein WAO95_12225 [Burkholderiales bacterium]